MKLGDFLKALAGSAQVQVSITDHNTSAQIATLMADGYASLEDTIENREVKRWTIVAATKITVELGDVIENNDPSNP